MRQLGLLIAWCLALAGCGSDRVSETIGEQVHAGNVIDLRAAEAGEWDRVCVLGPYSNDQTAKEALGFGWPVESRSSIQESDGISLLLFARGHHVVHSVEHPRDQGDFSELSGRCFPREQAQFVLRAGRADGWPELVPRNGA